MKVRVNDIEIYYEWHGDGEPLVLIMGLGQDSRLWRWQIEAYSKEFRCLAFDNRGAGQTDKPKGPYSIRQLAEDAAGLMDALGLEKAHIVGASMGGAIAQELAINYTHKIKSLSLHATFPKADNYFKQTLDNFLTFRRKLTPEEFGPALGSWIFTSHFFNERESELIALRKWMLANPYPMPEEPFAWQIAACKEHDTVDRLGKITSPTLITVGDRDILTPLHFAQLLAKKIPHARLAVLPDSGHGLNLEHPDLFNQITLDFLRSQKSKNKL
jgi:pimeloyl-ACP methyl ester carboxylesterase